MKKEALFQEKVNEKTVKCNLCPHNCEISVNSTGICQVRKNQNGKLYSLNYGKISSIGIDPIEKKPLYHFYPGSEILSLGSYGCNFHCDFCQNWQISQKKPHTKSLEPKEVIKLAKDKGVKSIAYTYSEPLVWYEFIKDTAKLAKKEGLKNVLVTNGYINQKPLKELLKYIDAANVDLKSFNNKFYKRYAAANVNPVKKSIKTMAEYIHIEITTLIIGGINSDLDELSKLFSWIANIDKSIPLHLSRYFPAYKMDKEATKISIMEEAYEKATEKLEYVYLGNIRNTKKNNTYCPKCGEELIIRNSYKTKNKLNKANCSNCDYEIYGEYLSN
ncbi:MAG: AmmeMemoRadiSam system radical SAM enzyme [Halanaerobiales bacterium]